MSTDILSYPVFSGDKELAIACMSYGGRNISVFKHDRHSIIMYGASEEKKNMLSIIITKFLTRGKHSVLIPGRRNAHESLL